MCAHVIGAFGRPDVFRVVHLPDPQPGPGELVVATAITNVKPVDHTIRRQGRSIARSLPAILGCDVVGTLPTLGADGSRVHLRRSAFRRVDASVERVPTSH